MLPGNSSGLPCLVIEATGDDDEGLAEEAMRQIVQGIMIALAFLAVKAVHKFKIPLMTECGGVIIIGFIVGAVLHVIDPRFGKAAAKFNADSFLLVILPPIIFDAGFSLTSSRSSLSSNAGTILMLAIFGTLISTVVVGTLLSFGGGISFWESYAFGALISAVDPVATLTVLNEVFPTNKPAMFYLVFGESVINDAVAIVLYTVCAKILKKQSSSMIAAFFEFWVVFFGSVVVGILLSLASALFLKVVDLRQHPTIELVIVFLSAGGMYSVAQALDFSGIMAIFVGGRLVKHWTLHNLSVANKIFLPRLIKAVAETAELYVFVFLGAAPWTYFDCLVWDPWFMLATFSVILLGRACNIFPLCFLSNLFRDSRTEKIKLTEQVFMWFSGLRGAIAFALASYGTHQGVLQHGDRLVTTTWATVIATVFIFGGLSKPMLKVLGLDPASNGESVDAEPLIPLQNLAEELDDSEEVVVIGAAHGPPPEVPEEESLHSKIWRNIRTCSWQSASWCLGADTRWIKPFVCLQETHEDRQREKICLKLLREGADYTGVLTALRRGSSRSLRRDRNSISTTQQSAPETTPVVDPPGEMTAPDSGIGSIQQEDQNNRSPVED